jgi:hypothetical protein
MLMPRNFLLPEADLPEPGSVAREGPDNARGSDNVATSRTNEAGATGRVRLSETVGKCAVHWFNSALVEAQARPEGCMPMIQLFLMPILLLGDSIQITFKGTCLMLCWARRNRAGSRRELTNMSMVDSRAEKQRACSPSQGCWKKGMGAPRTRRRQDTGCPGTERPW